MLHVAIMVSGFFTKVVKAALNLGDYYFYLQVNEYQFVRNSINGSVLKLACPKIMQKVLYQH